MLFGSHRGETDARAFAWLHGRDLLLLSLQNTGSLGVQVLGMHFVLRNV